MTTPLPGPGLEPTPPPTPTVLWTLESAGGTVLEFDDAGQQLTGWAISHGAEISKKPRYGGDPLVRVVSRTAATATLRGRVWHTRQGWPDGRQLAIWSDFDVTAKYALTDIDGRDYGEWFIERVDMQSDTPYDNAFMRSVFTIRLVEAVA